MTGESVPLLCSVMHVETQILRSSMPVHMECIVLTNEVYLFLFYYLQYGKKMYELKKILAKKLQYYNCKKKMF